MFIRLLTRTLQKLCEVCGGKITASGYRYCSAACSRRALVVEDAFDTLSVSIGLGPLSGGKSFAIFESALLNTLAQNVEGVLSKAVIRWSGNRKAVIAGTAAEVCSPHSLAMQLV